MQPTKNKNYAQKNSQKPQEELLPSIDQNGSPITSQESTGAKVPVHITILSCSMRRSTLYIELGVQEITSDGSPGATYIREVLLGGASDTHLSTLASHPDFHSFTETTEPQNFLICLKASEKITLPSK